MMKDNSILIPIRKVMKTEYIIRQLVVLFKFLYAIMSLNETFHHNNFINRLFFPCFRLDFFQFFLPFF